MKKQKENTVQKIVLKYDDGTKKEINKGVIITDNVGNNEDHNLTFEFANISGGELANIVLGVVQMGVEMGLFGDNE